MTTENYKQNNGTLSHSLRGVCLRIEIPEIGQERARVCREWNMIGCLYQNLFQQLWPPDHKKMIR